MASPDAPRAAPAQRVRGDDNHKIALILLIRGLRNSAPSTGSDPIHGSCEMFRYCAACSRPAIAKLCPSRSSTVVVAVRRVIAGMVVPEIVTALVKSSSLTSGLIDRLMIPWLEDRRAEPQEHAKIFELDGRRGDTDARGHRDRHRNLAASLETRGFAGQGHEIGLSQPLQQALSLERGYQAVDLQLWLLTISAKIMPNGEPTLAPTSVPAAWKMPLPTGAQIPAGAQLVVVVVGPPASS